MSNSAILIIILSPKEVCLCGGGEKKTEQSPLIINREGMHILQTGEIWSNPSFSPSLSLSLPLSPSLVPWL